MGIEDLLGSMRGRNGSTKVALKNEALADFRAKYQHIVGLKPGDKVQWKRGFKDCTIPADDEVVEVFETIPIIPKKRAASSESLDEYDFSIAFRDDAGNYIVYPFDSRRFERVVE